MNERTIYLLPMLLLLSCDSGCTDDGIERFQWEGEHVTVHGYGYSKSDVCAGSLPALDQRIFMIKEFLGVDSTPRFEHWWAADDVWEGFCPTDVPACARYDVAWSLRLPDMHEATHNIISSLNSGGCPPILSEGLAEYFDEAAFARSTVTQEFAVEDLIAHERLPLEAGVYTRAAHFTAYLLETYGPEAVIELCQAIPRDDSVVDWQTAMPKIVGLPLEDVLFLYELSYGPCTSHQVRARLWGCAGTPDFVLIGDDPQRDKYRLETDCNDPRTTNAAEEGGAVTTRLLYLPDDEWLNIEALAEGPSGMAARFTVQQCASCFDEPITIRSGDPGEPFLGDAHLLEAGFYEVTLFFDPRDRAELRID